MAGSRPAFELAALDIAGTTVQEGGVVYRVMRRVVATRVGSFVPDEVLDRWKGTSKREAVAGLLTDLTGSAEGADDTHDRLEEALAQEYRREPPSLLPGVAEAVAGLRKAGVRVVLQTGYERDVADLVLAAVGWRVGRDVDGLVTSDEVALSRPAPYLIFRAMELARVTRTDRVLVAGDTPNDILAGDNAGARFVVGVTTGAAGREVLESQPSTHVLDSLGEILALL